jgi:hypothetical protein
MLSSIIGSLISGAGTASTLYNLGTSAAIVAEKAKKYFTDHTLYYPMDIGGAPSIMGTTTFDRPVIVFSSLVKDLSDAHASAKIVFPIPQGLEFSDGASYDDATLGISGAAIYDTAAAAAPSLNQGQIGSAARGATEGAAGAITSLVKNMSVASAAAAGVNALNIIPPAAKTAVGIGIKVSMNRHIVTEFTGVGTRGYGFKFKMVASSQAESEMIRNICNVFREGLYPAANNLTLKYPPSWTIRFMKGSSDIEYIPKIWECYLQSVNVSYNSSGNLWHEDGSPLECDITVSFKETRNLTHKDIVDLKNNPFQNIPNTNKLLIPVKEEAPAAPQSNNTNTAQSNNTNTPAKNMNMSPEQYQEFSNYATDHT